jgi:hypothetical protein
LAVSAVVPAARVQLAAGLKVPTEFEVKLTVPVGVVGLDEVSVTVAVHVEVAPGRTVLGLQVTLVEVVCLPVTVTVTVAAELVLPL